MDATRLEALRECLYDSVLNGDALARLPERIADLVGGMSCLVMHQTNDGVIETTGYNVFDSAHLSVYLAEFAHEDPWTAIAARHGINRVVSTDRYLPLAEFERTRIYNEFAKPYGLEPTHCMGLVMPTATGVGILGIQRNRKQGAFQAAEEDALQRATPQISRFIELKARLANAERRAAAADAMFDHLAVGVLTVTADGRVLTANAAAASLMRSRDGLTYLRDRRLGAETLSQTARLQACIGRSAKGLDSGAMQVVRSLGAAPLRLVITPFRHPSQSSKAALILVQDPSKETVGLAPTLMLMFGLSKGEAQVALALAEGKTVQQIADERGVLISTVQTQLKRALEKTGTRKQSALTSVVGRIPLVRPLDND